MILQTVIYFLIFIFFTFSFFYLVGYAVIYNHNKSLKDYEIIALSFCLGLIIFLIFNSIFNFLHLGSYLLSIFLIFDIGMFIKFRFNLLSPWKVLVKDKLLALLLLLGILVQGIIDFPSGFLYRDGLLFWSSQGFDGLWHVSLMEEIKKTFPPQNPVFSGESLYNYHFLVDVVMGLFAKLLPFFSSLDLYYRFFPVLFSFLIGISVYSFMQRWQKNSKIAYWSLFFTYFTGSFGYIVTYLKDGNFFAGETVFWAAQLNTIVGNPPHAIAISLLLSSLLSLALFFQEKKRFWLGTSLLLGSFLVGFKVSSGVVLLLGLGAAALTEVIFKRRFLLLGFVACLGVINFLVIKILTRGVESYLIFEPWWFVRTMVVAKLGWIDLENQRQHYISVGTWKSSLRVVQVELMAFLIFLLGNLGMRMLGFGEIIKKILRERLKIVLNPLDTAVLVAMITSFIIPMLFLQKGIVYNSVQFMQYFLLFFGFYAAITTVKLIDIPKNKSLKIILATVIIFLSVPTVIGNLVEFYGPGQKPLAKISNQELEALDYLRHNTSLNDVILNLPFNKYLKDKYPTQPRPIYAWYSTAYISALTSRTSYLACEDMVDQLSLPLKEKLSKIDSFINSTDLQKNKEFLKKEGINYFYLSKSELDSKFDYQIHSLDQVFENNEVVIYKVRT